MISTISKHFLLINHVGYNTFGIKKVIFQTTSEYIPKTFSIIDSENKSVFSGKFEQGGQIDEWHTGKAYEGYFSEYTEEGTFQIVAMVNNLLINSHWFRIERSVISKICLPLILKGFQSQHPDNKYKEKDAHISFFGNRSDHVNVHGGWYDASGDVSKYLSHLSYANYLNPQQTPLVIWSILESYEILKRKSFVPNNFSESLAEEAVYGADFLVRMQDPEGYFYMTVFDNWSKDPEKREICAYKGQNGIRSDDYQAGFRQGGGMAIAALAKAGRSGYEGEYKKEIYIEKAVQGFHHLLKNNQKYLDNGIENIIDDYCFLLATIELYKTTRDEFYIDHARTRSQLLINRLYADSSYSGWWRADEEGNRPFFHASDAGLPLIALCKYLEIENDQLVRDEIILSIQSAIDFELAITNEVINPFGYPRQYVKPVNESEPKPSFFFPHNNETGYWWQGENARIASLATAMLMAEPYLLKGQKNKAKKFAINQVNWILGMNPYNSCMLTGTGYNNPEYLEPLNVNYRGGICNGITSGFENESDISFMPLPYNNDPAQQWRWSEQWIPHAGWFLMAISHI